MRLSFSSQSAGQSVGDAEVGTTPLKVIKFGRISVEVPDNYSEGENVHFAVEKDTDFVGNNSLASIEMNSCSSNDGQVRLGLLHDYLTLYQHSKATLEVGKGCTVGKGMSETARLGGELSHQNVHCVDECSGHVLESMGSDPQIDYGGLSVIHDSHGHRSYCDNMASVHQMGFCPRIKHCDEPDVSKEDKTEYCHSPDTTSTSGFSDEVDSDDTDQQNLSRKTDSNFGESGFDKSMNGLCEGTILRPQLSVDSQFELNAPQETEMSPNDTRFQVECNKEKVCGVASGHCLPKVSYYCGDEGLEQPDATSKKERFLEEKSDFEGVINLAYADIESMSDEKLIELIVELLQSLPDSEVDYEDIIACVEASFELLKAHNNADEDEEPHKRCREELLQLKEEFERYKLRAQSVLKNKSSKDVTTTKEADGVKKQNSDLKDRVKLLRFQMEEDETKHQSIVEDMRKSITRMQEKHVEELANAETDYKKRAAALEQQLHRHRDRTIALLVEKDKEIEMLKMGSPLKMGDSYAVLQRSRSTDSQDSHEGSPGSEEEAVVSSLIQKLTMSSGAQPDGALLHFAHEQARKNVEVNALRKQKHELESALRDLQQTLMTKEENYQEQIDALKEEIRKHARNKSRESANLEYLKNVVYHYMICSDTVGRKQMLNAIATILQFSPKEKKAVLKQISSWWGYSPPKGQGQVPTTQL